jgi:hypothetical protein
LVEAGRASKGARRSVRGARRAACGEAGRVHQPTATLNPLNHQPYPQLCALFINDLDAGAGRMGLQTQYTVNNQMVNATLMNIADNPTNVQLPGVYKEETIPRVPVICTGEWGAAVAGCRQGARLQQPAPSHTPTTLGSSLNTPHHHPTTSPHPTRQRLLHPLRAPHPRRPHGEVLLEPDP